MAHPLQCRLHVMFSANETDVSEQINQDVLSFEYTDKETNEADELSISLKDETGKWAGSWKPNGGETIKAQIYAGTTQKRDKKLYFGRFYVDQIRASGAPRTCEIRAVSIPLGKPIRRRIKSRAWEKKKLKEIAETIAKESELTLLYDCQENPSFDRQDQSKTSDLQFLQKLCEENGISLKVTDDTLVLFDQASYEKKEPIKTIELGVSPVLSWDFETNQSETYRSVTVSYRNPKEKKKGKAGRYDLDAKPQSSTPSRYGGETKKKSNPAVQSYTYTDPYADENGQEYALKKRATSLEDAKRLAKAKLRQLNARSVTGSLTLVGDTELVAGGVVEIKGFGSFDGKFIIEQAGHSVGSGGYTTALSLRRVNSEY